MGYSRRSFSKKRSFGRKSKGKKIQFYKVSRGGTRM